MMRLKWAGIALVLGTMPAVAALPPQYQRQAELRAIVDNMDVVDAFGFEGIDAIIEVETDLWNVRSGSCVIEVRIEDAPNSHGEGWVGPREFAVVVGEKTCN